MNMVEISDIQIVPSEIDRRIVCIMSAVRSDGQFFYVSKTVDCGDIANHEQKDAIKNRLLRIIETYAKDGCYCRMIRHKSRGKSRYEQIICTHHANGPESWD